MEERPEKLSEESGQKQELAAPRMQNPPREPAPEPPRGQYSYPSPYPQHPMYPYPPQQPFQPAPDLREARKDFSTMGLGVFMILLAANLLQVAVGVVLGIANPAYELPGWLEWVLTAVPMYAVAMPVGMAVIGTIPAQPPETQKIGMGKLLMVFLICIACMYGGNLFGILVTTLMELLFGVTSLNPVEDVVLGGGILPMAIVTALLAPVFEELVFRKFLIDRMRCYGERIAVITSALMFGLIHGNLSQLFYAFAVGLVLGYVYLRSGKLRYTIALHMVINFLGSVVPAILMDGLDLDALGSMGTITDPEAIFELLTPQLLGYYGYAMGMVCLAIVGLVLLVLYAGRVKFCRAPLELPRGTGFRTIWLNPGMILLVLACAGSIVLMCLVT